MSGINALSTGAATKNSDEGFSLTEKAQNGTDSAMLDFAAIFSNWVAQLSGQGQNSGFQSNEPASKDANSGKDSLLGLDGLQALVGMIQGFGNAQSFLGVNVQDVRIPTGDIQSEQIQALDSFITQIDNLQNASPSQTKGNAEEILQAGMPLGQSQGKSSPQLELALYKGVISELLKEMAGSMELKTPADSEGSSPIAQQKLELAAQRLNSGLFQMINEGDFTLKQIIHDQAVNIRQANLQTLSYQANDIQTANMQPVEIQTANKQGGTPTADQVHLNQEAAPIRLSANLDAIGFAYTKEQAGAKAEQQRMTQLANELRNSQEKESNSVGLTTAKTLTKEETPAPKSMLMTNMATGEKKNSSEIETYSQSSRTEENSGQEPGLEDLVNLTQVKGNVQVQDRASNKPDLPIWAQVAREVHDKAYQARPHLREMEIQLHPAELGQIRLSLRWEDGQVHLRMMASELGTGQMLQANLSELRDNLAQLGVQCGMMEMNMGNQQGNSREQGRNKSSQLRVESEDFQETQSVQTILDVESSSKINVTA